jgi:phosphatidylglycerol---prolipoprotein diacylglyceryl transferase
LTVLALLEWDPIVRIALGPLRISPHGLATAVGFLAGARLMLPAARARGIRDDQVHTMLVRAAVGALLGARLAYVVNHLGEYRDTPLDAFKVWEGGISLLGGIAGAILLAIPVMRRERLPFWSVMDAAAPGLALGILIGRIGDLVVGDHLGKPTDFVLGFRCTGADTASPCDAPIGQGVHLPALYDLASVTALLAVLLVLRRHKRWDGFLILTFAAWYGTGRIIEDFFRVDVTHGTGLTGSQWASVLVVAASLWILLARRRTPPWGSWSPGSHAPEQRATSERIADGDTSAAGLVIVTPDRGPDRSPPGPGTASTGEEPPPVP